MNNLKQPIEEYEKGERNSNMFHVYWKLSVEQRVFVDELIGFYKSMQRFVIIWPVDPKVKLDIDWRITTPPVEVECKIGNVHAIAKIVSLEFPISKEKQEYIEHALKISCLNEYIKLVETRREVGKQCPR